MYFLTPTTVFPENFIKRLRDSPQTRIQKLKLLFKKCERIVKRRNLRTLYEKKYAKVKGPRVILKKCPTSKISSYSYSIRFSVMGSP